MLGAYDEAELEVNKKELNNSRAPMNLNLKVGCQVMLIKNMVFQILSAWYRFSQWINWQSIQDIQQCNFCSILSAQFIDTYGPDPH